MTAITFAPGRAREQLIAMTDAQSKTPRSPLAEVDGIKLYYLTADHEEIVEIEARNTHKLELVTAA